MTITVLQNTPQVIDLATQAKTRGWTIGSGYADHEACNSGDISVIPSVFTPIEGQSYQISYQVSNYSSGTIQLRLGNTNGVVRSANGNYTETLVATGTDPIIKFYATGSLRLSVFDIRSNEIVTSNFKKNTVSFSEVNNKWSSFYSFTSDFGVTLNKTLFTWKRGRMHKHDPLIEPRNNIYGIQYQTSLKLVGNAGLTQNKTFLALSYEANQLMITTNEGVLTSIGNVSELIDVDFLKATLDDGVTEIKVYDAEGIYSSSFLRDMRVDINNGDVLKGTYIIVELIQTNNDLPLKLKNITIHSEPSAIGAR